LCDIRVPLVAISRKKRKNTVTPSAPDIETSIAVMLRSPARAGNTLSNNPGLYSDNQIAHFIRV
jgi:hypothetical protein